MDSLPVRYWPPARDTGCVQGEWELTIRGTEEDFGAAHKALFHAGFAVLEDPRYEVYGKKENVTMDTLTNANSLIDVWTLSFDDVDVVFEKQADLMAYLNQTMEDVDAGELIDFSIGREQMTPEEYEGLQEFDL